MTSMKTQSEVRAEIDRLLAADRIEEAAALVDELLPLSAEAFERQLEDAPFETHPPTAEDREVFDRAWKVLLGKAEEQGTGRPA